MKKRSILLIVLVCTMLMVQAQEASEEAFQEIRIDEQTIIKDLEGKQIDLITFDRLMQSSDFFFDELSTPDGTTYLQLRKATAVEKEMMTQMMPLNAPGQQGETVPEFSLTDSNGNAITSANTKGKVVVFNFWFTSCKPCISEIPALNMIYEKFKNRSDIVFAAITFETQERVTKFLKKYPLAYPTVVNVAEVCEKYTNGIYPTNVVIDKEGKYHGVVTGGNPQIADEIESLLYTALGTKE